MSYVITIDNMGDLPESYISEHKLNVISLSYIIENRTYTRGNELDAHEFYEKMREGKVPTTSQFNPDQAASVFSRIIEEQGCDIVHISVSSGISGSYSSAVIAANEVMEKYPGRRVVVIDSLCASMGEGLFIYKLVEMWEDGASMDELVKWGEENKLHFCHNFTVEDLIYLYRGGRVSRTSAIMGGMLDIKPVLHVNNEGKLVPVGKKRGRRRSLDALVDNMEENMGSYRDKCDMFFISHGDTEDDAKYVIDKIRSRFGIEKYMTNCIGPTIGAHAGPGTIALFYIGEKR